MQASLPTHAQQPADPRLQFGPITAAITAAASAAITAIVCTACTTLGSTILQAAGKEAVNMPGYTDLLIPTLLGTTIVAGGLGFLAGCCSPDSRTA
jgi:5,10-methenyltetrahydromethanopterin hydrogenase